MSKVTSCTRFKFEGQIEKHVTPLIVDVVQPELPADRTNEGVDGGVDIALTVIVLELDVPFGSDSVNVIV